MVAKPRNVEIFFRVAKGWKELLFELAQGFWELLFELAKPVIKGGIAGNMQDKATCKKTYTREKGANQTRS